MFRIYPVIIAALAFLSLSCVAHSNQGVNPPSNNKDQIHTRAISSADSPIEFYRPAGAPQLTDLEGTRRWANLLANNMTSLIPPLTVYHQVNGKLPSDLASLLNGYVIFLPANPATLKPYDIIELKNINEPIPAGSIVVDLSKDGWDLYRAKPKPDGGFDTIIFSRDELGNLINETEATPNESRMVTFRKMLRSWAILAIQTYANRHGKIPGSYDELTEGYIRNPATNLDYEIWENGFGSFRIGVKPDDYLWAFAFTGKGGAENFTIYEYKVDEYGHYIGSLEMILPEATEENRKGFKWILSHEEFIE